MSYNGMATYPRHTLSSPRRDGLVRGGRTRFHSPETRLPRARPPRIRVPVRGTSVVTGLRRSCRADLIGFASPTGRLSAILRITDEATGHTATSVVPVELPARVAGATRTAEMTIPHSEVRARELRAETKPVRLVPSLHAGSLLDELLTAHLDGTSAHRLALVLTTALDAGALASTPLRQRKRTAGSTEGPESRRNRRKEGST